MNSNVVAKPNDLTNSDWILNSEIVKNYIDVLNSEPDKNKNDIEKLMVLHNCIILENIFRHDVKLKGKEINKYLKLMNTRNIPVIKKICTVLFKNDSIVKKNIETFNEISSVSKYCSTNH